MVWGLRIALVAGPALRITKHLRTKPSKLTQSPRIRSLTTAGLAFFTVAIVVTALSYTAMRLKAIGENDL